MDQLMVIQEMADSGQLKKLIEMVDNKLRKFSKIYRRCLR
jgi:hypothetical protein